MNKDTTASVLFFIDRMIQAREMYDSLKQDEENRQTSTVLGIRALIYDAILLIVLGGATALAVWGITMESGWRIALYIVAGLLALAAIPFYIIALSFSTKQLRLNKRPVGWISLVALLLLTVACVVSIAVTALMMA